MVVVGFTSEYNIKCLISIPIIADLVKEVAPGTIDLLIHESHYKATLTVSPTVFNPVFEINGVPTTSYFHIYGR